MPLIIADDQMEEIIAERSGSAPIVLLEISSPFLGGEIIRLADNNENFISNGHTYIGLFIEMVLPSATDKRPEGSISMPHYDLRISRLLQSVPIPLRVRMMVAFSTHPNIYPQDFRHFKLKRVQGNDIMLSGSLVSWDLGEEPWPNRRVTADRFPGVFF